MELDFFFKNWKAIKHSKEFNNTLDRIFKGELPYAFETFSEVMLAMNIYPIIAVPSLGDRAALQTSNTAITCDVAAPRKE